MAECIGDVSFGLAYARNLMLPFAVKGGGHSAAGYSLVSEGVVIDMSRMNATTIVNHYDDENSNIAVTPTLSVEAGATFAHIYEQLNGTGFILAGGGCSTVGVLSLIHI